MPLEDSNSVATLNPSYPLGTDPVASADDHIRLIKSVLKTTFPKLDSPVTVSPNDLNTRGVPTGFIGMWSGAAAAIPAGWLLCDGTKGTPDLRDRFIVGAGGNYLVGASGGSILAATSVAGSHSHTVNAGGAHTPTGTAASHVLTVDEIPAHHHQGWGESQGDAPWGTSSDKGHKGSGQTDNDNYYYNTSDTGGGQGHSHDVVIQPVPDHTHTTAATGDHNHAIDTRSPYYALCMIMKG